MPIASHPEHVCEGGMLALAATDFSPAGNDAAAWAASHLKPCSRLLVAHALEAASDEASTATSDRLSELARGLPAGGATIETHIIRAKPSWEAIANEANAQRG